MNTLPAVTIRLGGLCLLAAVGLLVLDVSAAPGQTSVSEVSPTSGSSASPEPGEASEEPDVKSRRRVFPRVGPQPLTEEQHEEAVRVRKLARKFGTDPTAIVGRVQLTSQYLNLPQGGQGVATVFRTDLPYRHNFVVRADVPFLRWNIPDRPGATSARGMSDVAVTAGWRAYNTPEYAIFLGVQSTYPTADQNTLGLGKYTLGPFLATGRFLPHLDSLLFGVFQHQSSVGGDATRQSVEVSRFVAQLNTIWDDRLWTLVQSIWQIDWEQNAKSSMTLEFEVGRNVVGRLGAFVRPGVGIWGRQLVGAYDWNIEVGIRYMFGSF
ncbi:hypothetical protein YTPLAS18_28870 [Nitrospira sp.]|nr:hypothetical protein YTPLAS18_28870 [Nitrospira sp.]